MSETKFQDIASTIRLEEGAEAVIVIASIPRGEDGDECDFAVGSSGSTSTIYGMLRRYLRLIERLDDIATDRGV